MNNTSSKYIAITEIPSLDAITARDSKKAFLALKEKGIIIGGIYEGNRWLFTDERVTCTIDFSFDEELYNGNLSFLGIPAEDMISHMKKYVLCSVGKYIVHTIQSIVREIRYILQDKAETYTDNQLSHISHVSEFFSLLPYPENVEMEKVNSFLNTLTDIEDHFECMSNTNQQRTLASFDSYFKFNEILDQFWGSASTEQKLFFFPIYLWWKLSGVIPMRPTEFVLTPRDCLVELDGETYIEIRKTSLKGRSSAVTYKVDSDYKIVRYVLSEDIAKEIRWYIEKTNAFTGNDLHTLFCADTHYSQWGHCVPYISRYYTYINLSTCLRYFYKQIIEESYHYAIVYDRGSSYLRDREINYLYLGDTRHLALISMISQGATPVVAMMLAGHKNIDITAHYYSNIGHYIECKTYRQFKALQKEPEKYALSVRSHFPSIRQFASLDMGGRCYSSNYAKGSYEDCAKTAGPNGELGYCMNCDYYYPECNGLQDQRERHLHKIQYECQMLSDIVDKVRKNRGEPEEIIQVLLNLRSAENSYQKYLEEEMERKHYGKEEKSIHR